MSLRLAPTRTPEVATTASVTVSHGVINLTLHDSHGQPIAWLPFDDTEARTVLAELRVAITTQDLDRDGVIADLRMERASIEAAQRASETWL